MEALWSVFRCPWLVVPYLALGLLTLWWILRKEGPLTRSDLRHWQMWVAMLTEVALWPFVFLVYLIAWWRGAAL